MTLRTALRAVVSVCAVVGAMLLAPVAQAAGDVIPCATAPFTDVAAGATFCRDIEWLAAQGITEGYPDGTFNPSAAVTREAMSAFLYRLANPGTKDPACVGSGAASDVPVTYPFCGTVGWLMGKKISEGYPDGTFNPSAAVTREAMSAFLYRLANPGKSDPSCTAAPFNDVAVGSTFCGTISWLKGQSISGGYADGGFHPKDPVSREAMAAFLHRTADTLLTTVTLGASTVTVGPGLAAGRYKASGDGGKVQVVRGDRVLVSEKLGAGGVPSVTVTLNVGDKVTVSGAQVTFAPAVAKIGSTLSAGIWLVGRDIAPGIYDATPGAGQSGTLTVGGKPYLLADGAGASGPAQASVTVTLKIGAEVAVEGMSALRFVATK